MTHENCDAVPYQESAPETARALLITLANAVVNSRSLRVPANFKKPWRQAIANADAYVSKLRSRIPSLQPPDKIQGPKNSRFLLILGAQARRGPKKGAGKRGQIPISFDARFKAFECCRERGLGWYSSAVIGSYTARGRRCHKLFNPEPTARRPVGSTNAVGPPLFAAVPGSGLNDSIAAASGITPMPTENCTRLRLAAKQKRCFPSLGTHPALLPASEKPIFEVPSRLSVAIVDAKIPASASGADCHRAPLHSSSSAIM